MDTVDRQTRSKIMASMGQKNAAAETLLRGGISQALKVWYRLTCRTVDLRRGH